MKGFWKTHLNDQKELTYFKELLGREYRAIYERVKPYVTIISNKDGSYKAYCDKKAPYTEWLYVTGAMSNFRHKEAKKDIPSVVSPHYTSFAAIPAIKEYCENRNYKCGGCRYSLIKAYKAAYGDPYKEVSFNAGEATTCIFGNCPCSWEV